MALSHSSVESHCVKTKTRENHRSSGDFFVLETAVYLVGKREDKESVFPKISSVQQHIFQVGDDDFDSGIGFDFLADFVAGVDDGGVVATAEELTYRNQGHRKQIRDEINRNHSRLDDVFRLFLGKDIRGGDVEISANGGYDVFRVQGFLFFVDEILQCVVGKFLGVDDAVCKRTEKIILLRRPSISRMLVVAFSAMNSATSSESLKFSCAAFILRMATRVSILGGWMSTESPQEKRVRRRSSRVGKSLGARSDVMMICLLD